MLGYTNLLEGTIRNGSFTSETLLTSLTFSMMIFVPSVCLSFGAPGVALFFFAALAVLNLYFLPHYHWFLRDYINSQVITFEEFSKLIPANIQGEGVPHPWIKIFTKIKKRNFPDECVKNELEIPIARCELESESIDIRSEWEKFSPLSFLEVRISLTWQEDSLKILKEKQDMLWGIAARYHENHDLYFLTSELNLGTASPLKVFQNRTSPQWGALQDGYMTKSQTVGYGREYLIGKPFCVDVNASWWRYGVGYIASIFVGLCVLLKQCQKKEFRQRYSIWIAPEEKLQSPNQVKLEKKSISSIIREGQKETGVELCEVEGTRKTGFDI